MYFNSNHWIFIAKILTLNINLFKDKIIPSGSYNYFRGFFVFIIILLILIFHLFLHEYIFHFSATVFIRPTVQTGIMWDHYLASFNTKLWIMVVVTFVLLGACLHVTGYQVLPPAIRKFDAAFYMFACLCQQSK